MDHIPVRDLPQSTGWIEVICGSMFSGKTEELIRRLRRAQIAKQRVAIFKSSERLNALAALVASRRDLAEHIRIAADVPAAVNQVETA